MTPDSIGDLLRAGRIENIPPDTELAEVGLSEAKRHLESARRIAASDPKGAYALLYDAARKAVAAHMLASGYRVRARPGAHQAVVRYAEEALGAGSAREHVLHLDRMRRNRNRSEYEVRVFGVAEIEADLNHARHLAAAVEAALGGR